MGILKKFFAQTRKPEGFLGKLMVGGMNGGGHAKLADWGLSHLDGTSPETIAELGCDGGWNAKELLRHYPGAKLTALDYSEISVEKTKAYNKAEIAAGRCSVVRGSVDRLPLRMGNSTLPRPLRPSISGRDWNIIFLFCS